MENSIDVIRNSFMAGDMVNISLDYGTAWFERGQKFLDWVAEKKKSLQEFIEGEIIQ